MRHLILFLSLFGLLLGSAGCPSTVDDDDATSDDDDATGDDDDATGDDDDATGDDDDATGDDDDATGDDDDATGDDDDATGDDDDATGDDDDATGDDDDATGDDDDATGDDDDSTEPIDADGDGVDASLDCDDADPNNFPGNTEVCDGDDNDCDGLTFAIGEDTDVDTDGSFTCLDCDDADPNNFPGNTEVCDGSDNDCDSTTFATGEDTDGDSDGVATCLDCDDADPNNFPGNAEICDGSDNDCDTNSVSPGEDTDGDIDGVATCLDCDDADPDNFPGNTEVCDGNDNDCDSTTFATDEDTDGDTDGVVTCLDCDDANGDNFPGNTEVCDGGDNDCDTNTFATGEDTDGDGDGSFTCLDCDDGDADNFPGNTEVCDGLDNDCDSTTFAADEDTDSDGDGAPLCLDCDDADGDNFPGNAEVCDGDDNDCDQSTSVADENTDDDLDGAPLCDDCDDGDPDNFPGNAEVCDGDDNDCDQSTVFPGEDTDVDGDGSITCLDCDDGDGNNFPGNIELCDDLDTDCDAASVYAPDAWEVGTSQTSTFVGAGNLGGSTFTVTELVTVRSFGANASGAGTELTLLFGSRTAGTQEWFVESLGEPNALTGASAWYDSGPVDIGLSPGDEYFVGYYVDGPMTLYYDAAPAGPSWLSPIGYSEVDDSSLTTVPTSSWTPTEDAAGSNYSTRITVADETDFDGDGFTSCTDDCDDDDSLAFAGNPEVCDGIDNDCDFAVDLTSGLLQSAPGTPVGPSSGTITTDVLTVDLGGSVEDLDVLVDITHSWTSDVTVTLTSPSGVTANLFDGIGGSGDYLDLELDDESSNSLPTTTTTPGTSGTFQTRNDPLSLFDGEVAAGDWTITVTDTANGDGGTLNSWGLEFNVSTPGASPVCAARSCADILAVDSAAPDGLYWIDGYSVSVADQYNCDMTNGGWTEVWFEDYDTIGPSAEWSATATYDCAGDVLLGGYNNIAGGTLEIEIDTTVHEHTEARVATEYWFLDSWDGETGWIDVDGSNLWFQTQVTGGTTNLCGAPTTSWTDSTASIDAVISHTDASLFYSAGSNLDQTPDDESFGVDDVAVWIR